MPKRPFDHYLWAGVVLVLLMVVHIVGRLIRDGEFAWGVLASATGLALSMFGWATRQRGKHAPDD